MLPSTTSASQGWRTQPTKRRHSLSSLRPVCAPHPTLRLVRLPCLRLPRAPTLGPSPPLSQRANLFGPLPTLEATGVHPGPPASTEFTGTHYGPPTSTGVVGTLPAHPPSPAARSIVAAEARLAGALAHVFLSACRIAAVSLPHRCRIATASLPHRCRIAAALAAPRSWTNALNNSNSTALATCRVPCAGVLRSLPVPCPAVTLTF